MRGFRVRLVVDYGVIASFYDDAEGLAKNQALSSFNAKVMSSEVILETDPDMSKIFPEELKKEMKEK